jgi:hypothetical protein
MDIPQSRRLAVNNASYEYDGLDSLRINVVAVVVFVFVENEMAWNNSEWSHYTNVVFEKPVQHLDTRDQCFFLLWNCQRLYPYSGNSKIEVYGKRADNCNCLPILAPFTFFVGGCVHEMALSYTPL